MFTCFRSGRLKTNLPLAETVIDVQYTSFHLCQFSWLTDLTEGCFHNCHPDRIRFSIIQMTANIVFGIENDALLQKNRDHMSIQTAILAGGCFWGVEELIRALPGVAKTTVGYTGGDVRNATYRNHGTHAEGIKIEFDSDLLSYRKLLEFFFQIHDPTTRNRQGNDIGTSYRSAVFYLDEEQKNTATELIAELSAAKIWSNPIVTEVVPASDFWDAEEEHQDYLQKHPYGYTCHFIRPDWQLAATENK